MMAALGKERERKDYKVIYPRHAIVQVVETQGFKVG
jgi:hypothetical protein